MGLEGVYWGDKHKRTQDLGELTLGVPFPLTCKHTVTE